MRLVIGLWNQCAEAHRYETVYTNDKLVFLCAHRDLWSALGVAEMIYNGDFRVVDAYIYIDGCDHLVFQFNPGRGMNCRQLITMCWPALSMSGMI